MQYSWARHSVAAPSCKGFAGGLYHWLLPRLQSHSRKPLLRCSSLCTELVSSWDFSCFVFRSPPQCHLTTLTTKYVQLWNYPRHPRKWVAVWTCTVRSWQMRALMENRPMSQQEACFLALKAPFEIFPSCLLDLLAKTLGSWCREAILMHRRVFNHS